MAGFTPPLSPVGPGPAVHGVAVTPADTDLGSLTRYIWVGGTGDLVVLLAGDDTEVTLTAVPDGTWLALCCQQVKAATTATNIVAFW
jgi:hypothetical protein